MEVEGSPSVVLEATREPSSVLASPPSLSLPTPAVPSADTSGTAAIIAMMAQMQESIRLMNEKSEAKTAALERRVEELTSMPSGSIPGLPIESCPPTSSDNPWRR